MRLHDVKSYLIINNSHNFSLNNYWGKKYKIFYIFAHKLLNFPRLIFWKIKFLKLLFEKLLI